MKKIIIINHYGITPDLPGATKHYDMAKHFSNKTEYAVEFWMCGYNHHTGEHHKNLKGFKIQSKERIENFDVVRIKSTPYRKSSLARQINISIFDILTAIKIFFSKDVQAVVLSVPPISIFNTLATKMKKIKLIADVEDLWPLFLTEMGMNNKVASKYMTVCADYLYKVSDGIAAVSEGMLNYVKNRSDRKEDSAWLAPLGVNIKEYSGKKTNIEVVKDSVWKEDFKIMYVGAHGKANDLSSILETVKIMNSYNGELTCKRKKISFIFIGDGDQRTELVKLKEKYKLNNVYFEKAIPGNQVADYLLHADICLTNLKKIESFKLVRPNKLFQYMALKKPIVSGIWGEAKNIVEGANSGKYIDFTVPEVAAEALIKFISSDNLIEYGNNGRSYVEKHGNRDMIFEDYYNKIVKIIKSN